MEAIRLMATIKCPRCGEEYSTTYRRCPFCAEAANSSRSKSGGRRVVNNTRGGGYGGRRSRFGRIFLLLLSVVIIIAAICIVAALLRGIFSHTGGLFHREKPTEIVETQPPAATGFELSTEELTFYTPGQQAAIAVVFPEGSEATVTDLTWTSSRPTVATVDGTGLVTALEEGTTTITVTAGDTARACIVNCYFGEGQPLEDFSQPVEPIPTGEPLNVVTIYGSSGADFSIAVGEAVPLKATGGAGTYTWTSSNPGIASVDTDGTVRGVGAGMTTVLCTSGDSAYECIVRVH